MGLWSLAMSYCCDQLTDGFIPKERVAKIAAGHALAKRLGERLRTAVLWHRAEEACPRGHAACDHYIRAEDGYRFHDWDDYQPSKEEVEAERSRKKRNLQAHRDRKRASNRRETGPETDCETGFTTEQEPVRNHGPIPYPFPVGSTEPKIPQEPTTPAVDANPAVERVVEALRTSTKLRSLASRDFAQRCAVHCREHGFTGRKSLAEVLAAIGDADAKVQDKQAANELVTSLSGLVISFVKRPSIEHRTAPPRGRSAVQPGPEAFEGEDFGGWKR
jgi:hypothetical protein